MTDIHPVLAEALAAIRALHAYQPASPADLAALIEGTAGDGTGATCLITEITRIVHSWTHTPATADLHPDDRADICNALALWRMTADHPAGEHAATALDILQPAPTAVGRELAEATT